MHCRGKVHFFSFFIYESSGVAGIVIKVFCVKNRIFFSQCDGDQRVNGTKDGLGILGIFFPRGFVRTSFLYILQYTHTHTQIYLSHICILV